MAIYRTRPDGIAVRLDSRTVTVTGATGTSANRLAAVARAENGGERVTLQASWSDSVCYVHRRYTRTQQV